jgi:hypothetical protein
MIKEYRMQDRREAYFDQLLSELKLMEQRVVSVRNSDALPFSFFNESFDKTQKIARLLHEMQLMQIDDMKQQMERLVMFLSESEAKSRQDATGEEHHPGSEPLTEEIPDERSASSEEGEDRTADLSQSGEQSPAPSQVATPALHEGNIFSSGINLPEYRDPRSADHKPSPAKPNLPSQETERDENPVFATFNDTIKAPPAVLDLKRGISLNDRFLFQRELFNNDRHQMNNVMIRLNAFDNYPGAEAYLKEAMAWNFNDPVVKNFLQAIKKGFE